MLPATFYTRNDPNVLSTIFYVFRKQWAHIFNDDPGLSLHYNGDRLADSISTEVVTLVASIMPLLALFQVFDGTSAVTAGIFRARGKQVSSLVSLHYG